MMGGTKGEEGGRGLQGTVTAVSVFDGAMEAPGHGVFDAP